MATRVTRLTWEEAAALDPKVVEREVRLDLVAAEFDVRRVTAQGTDCSFEFTVELLHPDGGTGGWLSDALVNQMLEADDDKRRPFVRVQTLPSVPLPSGPCWVIEFPVGTFVTKSVEVAAPSYWLRDPQGRTIKALTLDEVQTMVDEVGGYRVPGAPASVDVEAVRRETVARTLSAVDLHVNELCAADRENTMRRVLASFADGEGKSA